MAVHVYLLIHRKEEGGFEEKTKELFPLRSIYRLLKGMASSHSWLFYLKTMMTAERRSIILVQAAMVFDSPKGIAFVKKWHEVINLYQTMYGLIMFYISVLYI
jgi:hypothetical protein